jgi:hypothetical protein
MWIFARTVARAVQLTALRPSFEVLEHGVLEFEFPGGLPQVHHPVEAGRH